MKKLEQKPTSEKPKTIVSQLVSVTDNLAALQMACQLEDGVNRLNSFLTHENCKVIIRLTIDVPF